MSKPPSRRVKRRFELATDVVVNKGIASVNMSESGMLLECPTLPSVGRKMEIGLNLSGSIVNVNCTVRWSRPNSSAFSDQFLCGVEFSELKASELLLVRHFLEQFDDDELNSLQA